MIGWTIFNCLCLGVCLIFMFGYDKEYLSNLLKYDATIIVYIFSSINALRALPWGLDCDAFTGSQVFCTIMVCASIATYCILFLIITATDGFPNVEFIKKYIEIDENNPRISYKLFKQMYALHPDKFYFYSFAWEYNDIHFSLNFFDYLRASLLIESRKQESKNRDYDKDYQRLISEMQADLEKDLVAARKEKEQAFQEVEDAAKDAHELFKALSKYN